MAHGACAVKFLGASIVTLDRAADIKSARFCSSVIIGLYLSWKEVFESKAKMCYSVVGLMGQAQQVSNVPSPPTTNGVVDMSYGGSPHSGSSGYASYSSPSSDAEHELEFMPYGEESPPQLMQTDVSPSRSPPAYSPVGPGAGAGQGPGPERMGCSFGYPGPPPISSGFLDPDYDPMYCSDLDLYQQERAACGLSHETAFAAKYGHILGSNFCLSNFPQVSELGSPKSPNHSLQHTLCKVCNDTASGNHFGVQSCEACKSFFRRSIRANARYACRGNRGCAIEKHTRNRCQYCRLQKCVAMGMRKEAVQEERTPAGAKLQRAGTPQPLGFPNLNFIPPPVPYVPNFDSPTSPVPRLLSQSSRMYGSLPNLKMEFERPGTSQLSHPGMMSSVRSFTPPLDGVGGSGGQFSISTLVNADMQAEGAPEEVKPAEGAIKIEDLFEGIRSSLLKVIEWAKRLPAFINLSLDDQVKLLKAGWCELCTLKLAARNGPKSEVVLLGHGVSCKRDQIEDPEVRRVFHRTFTEVAYWLDYLNVDRVEMACLKGIILFNPDAKGLSPSSRKKVEIYQEQILQNLETRTKTMYPVSPQRFSKLLLRLAPLKAIALELMQHMEVQRALGNTKMDNLFGELLDFE